MRHCSCLVTTEKSLLRAVMSKGIVAALSRSTAKGEAGITIAVTIVVPTQVKFFLRQHPKTLIKIWGKDMSALICLGRIGTLP